MKYAETTDPATNVTQVVIEIHPLDMVGVKLYPHDRLLLLRECNTSLKISDKLLALECIARRITVEGIEL